MAARNRGKYGVGLKEEQLLALWVFPAARPCLFSPIVPCAAAAGGLAAKALSRDSFAHRSLLSQQFGDAILPASEEMSYFKSADCACRWQRAAPERGRSPFSPSRHGRGSLPEQAARSPLPTFTSASSEAASGAGD